MIEASASCLPFLVQRAHCPAGAQMRSTSCPETAFMIQQENKGWVRCCLRVIILPQM